MKKPLKVTLVIAIAVILLLSLAYVTGYSKLKKEYQKEYNTCLEKLPEIQQLMLDNPNIYQQIQECTNNGGCYTACEYACGPSKSSGYTFSESLLSLYPLQGCLMICKSGCLYH